MRKNYIVFFLLVNILFSINKVDALGVYRLTNASSNNELGTLNASGTDLELKRGKYNYDVVFKLDSDTTKIYATTKSKSAKFVEGFGPRTVKLNFGQNEILIKVQAENGDVATYVVNIKRKDTRKSNNYLSNIVVNGKALNFDKDKLKYSFSVKKQVEYLDIKVSTENPSSNVKIKGNKYLKYGSNEVYIDVSAENGSLRQYLLKVYRSKSDSIPLSSNTSLALLRINNYKINFDSNVLEYELMVKDESDLEIDALAEDENAVVKIIGRKNIKHGGIVEVRVIAEDGSQEVYKIKTLIEGMTIVNKAVIAILIVAVVAIISTIILIVNKLVQKSKQGSIMNFEVVRTDIPTIDTNSEEDQKLMSFLLGKEDDVGIMPNQTKNMNTGIMQNTVNATNQTTNINHTDYASHVNQAPMASNSGFQKSCPFCGTINSASSIVCVSCGNSLINR